MRIDKRSTILAALVATTALGAILAKPSPAAPWPPYLTEWQTIYPASLSDDNVIAGLGMGCALCHFNATGGSPWNPYGWEIRQRFLGGMTIHDAIVASEKWDSEPNPLSWSNITEITAGTQPGWTAGAVNYSYSDGGTTTGNSPPAIAGSLDPASSPMIPRCDPGTGTVIPCPCGNPQSGLNRGCENSSGTTGAAMTGAGVASLAADSLVFTTAGQRATALCILLQGKTVLANGVVYGQGVRCVNTGLERLYSKQAVGGSVTVPDFGAGEPTVSVRSAAKGDTILAGEKRWYLIFYRDPAVLGGCPPASGYNSTQTGEVLWLRTHAV